MGDIPRSLSLLTTAFERVAGSVGNTGTIRPPFTVFKPTLRLADSVPESEQQLTGVPVSATIPLREV
jgi:hypothetical protein